MANASIGQDEFVRRALERHEGRYTYELTRFTSTKKKITITCSQHGPFTQNAGAHIYKGHGCPGCSAIENRYRPDEFIALARERFGARFNYDKVVYVDSKTHVTITCPAHGDFDQSPNCHLRSTESCPSCGRAATGNATRGSLDRFRSKSIEIHGDRYDYSHADYKDVRTPVTIVCPDHGSFEMTPISHYQGSRCPTCRESRGELAVRRELECAGVDFVAQWSHPTLRHIRPLRFDFALPSRRIAIEFDGGHHFGPVKFRGLQSDEQALHIYEYAVLRDSIKETWAAENDWTVIRISAVSEVRAVLVQSGVIEATEEERESGLAA